MSEPEATSETELRANAWCGEAAAGNVDAGSMAWGVRRTLPKILQFLAPVPVLPSDWTDERVGWGLVLPDRPEVSGADKAAAKDAPEPLKALLQARAPAPVFRWSPGQADGTLRWYDPAGKASDPGFTGLRGTAPNAIPRYLLIAASPEEIPWNVQYAMQLDAHVGRLDLDAAGLENYVQALLSGWTGSSVDPHKPLVWAADLGYPDITRLMRKTVAEKIANALRSDPQREFEMTDGFLTDEKGTGADLLGGLAARNPAFVVTSSHGATFPLDDAGAMKDQLGQPVDVNHAVVGIKGLTEGWDPFGAIWYSHACCSAGSDGKSQFEGLVDVDSSLGRTLNGITAVGACTAPLPKALLGAKRHLRAFVGHVEPTFEWTLRSPLNQQVTTSHIVNALYDELHLATRPPIGLAMETYFKSVGMLLKGHIDALTAVNEQEPGAQTKARLAKLIAWDRLGTVVLGDPTVALPASAI